MINVKILSKLLVGAKGELDEGKREDDVRSAFPDKTSIIDWFIDPIRQIENNKYLMWMVKHADESNKGLVHSTVHFYNLIVKKGTPDKDKPELKNIDTFKSLEDLEGFVEDYDKSIKELEREGAKVIYPNDGRWEIIRPLNVQASCNRGANSQWCIAATKSKNYYKPYTKSGAVFYTIIDYSKKPKDKDSMFTYVFVRDLPETHRGSRYIPSFVVGGGVSKIEVYDAEDEKFERSDMESKLPGGIESRFFNLMKDDLGLGELSSQLENYNHFFPRLKRLLKAQKDKEEAGGLFGVSSGALSETEEFIEEWYEEYSGRTKIYNNKKKALRNIYSILDRIIELDEPKFKKELAKSIERKYIDELQNSEPIPKLSDYIAKLKFNPNWLDEMEGLYNKLSSKEYYNDTSKSIYDITSEMKQFIELSSTYKQYDGLAEIFQLYLEFNSSYKFNSQDEREKEKKGLINEFIKTLMKYNNPTTIKFLDYFFDDIVGGDEYLIRDALSMLIVLPNTLKKEELRKKYRTHMAERSLLLGEMSQNKREINNIATTILGEKDIDPAVFDKAMKLSDSPLAGLDNPALIEASEESVTKVGNAAMSKYKEERNLSKFYRYCMFILRANNVSKKIAEEFFYGIALINTSRMRTALTNSVFSQIILKLEDILDIKFWDEIDKIRDQLHKAGALHLLDIPRRADESKLFKFNKDYKVFKIL